MQCSVCEKTFATELSVCPSCGAMPTQHTQAESSLRFLSIEKITTSDLELEIGEPPARRITAPLEEKTSSLESRLESFRTQRSETRTLLEFPAKRNKSPEWRDEIKNLVKRRKDISPDETAKNDKNEVKPKKTVAEPALVINLKPNIAEQKKKNILADALERIERSRQQFGRDDIDELIAESVIEEASLKTVASGGNKKSEAVSNSTLTLVPPCEVLNVYDEEQSRSSDSRPAAFVERKSVFNVPLNLPVAPNEILTRTEKRIEIPAAENTALGELEDEETINAAFNSVRKVSVKQSPLDNQQPAERISAARSRSLEKIEDYAPLGQRLAAGVIDAVMSTMLAFGLLLALGAVKLTSFGWLSLLLTASAASGILFAYLTISLLLTRTTVGLKFFQMRVVAAENGDSLSVGQTVINSAVYVLSLWLAGVGLLTVLLSTEKRALHDIAAGTVVIQD